MKTFASALLLAILAPGSVLADTLTTRDGKSIEWTAIRDLGDSVEVETVKGEKLTIKKADVEKITLGPSTPPLTGASFTFDKARKTDTVDLLSKIDLKRDVVSGQWKMASDGLIGMTPKHGKLQIECAPPGEEYDLVMVVDRTEGADDLAIGFIGPNGKQVAIFFDSFQSTSGLALVDGKSVDQEGGISKQAKVFKNGTPKLITLMVRKDALAVQIDQKDFLITKLDWTKVSVHPAHAVPSKTAFFLMTYASTFKISKFFLKVPKLQKERP